MGAQLQTFPLSNGIKIVSVLQRLHSEIGRTNSAVQKRNGNSANFVKIANLSKNFSFWGPTPLSLHR